MTKPCGNVLAGAAIAACVVGSRAFTGPVLSRGILRPASFSPRATSPWTPRMAVTEEPQVSKPSVSSPTSVGSDAGKESKKAEMVVVNKENTEFSAGVIGGVAGFVIGGPVLAALLAIAANYGSKRDNEAGQAVRAVATNGIEALNFLTTINSKYDVTGKTGAKLSETVDKLKDNGEAGQTVEKVEKVLKDLTSQASKISTDYDLPAKAKQALGVAGELADTAIVKGIEVEKEYKLTDKVKETVKKTIDGSK